MTATMPMAHPVPAADVRVPAIGPPPVPDMLVHAMAITEILVRVVIGRVAPPTQTSP